MPNAEKVTETPAPSAPAVKPMSGRERAALLLLMLGEEKAAEVLRFVDAQEVEQIGMAMASIRGVDSKRAEAVIDGFQRELVSLTPLGVGVPGYVRKLMVSTMGEQKGNTLAEKLLGSGGEDQSEIDSLRWMDLDTVTQILRDEHPQMIAITLVHLDQDQAAAILGKLPGDLQDDVMVRIATMEKVPKPALKELQSILKKKLSLSASFKSKQVDGAQSAASIINFMDKEAESRILELIGKRDEKLSERIQDLMFVFGNLVGVNDKGMQLLLREISNDLLSVALKGADEPVREKVFNNMSKRAREMLIEDMEAKGPVRISDVEAAQKEILQVARRLADEGQITLGGSREAMVE